MVRSNRFIKEQLGEVGEATIMAAAQPDRLQSDIKTVDLTKEKERRKPFSAPMIACAGVLLCCGVVFCTCFGLWENGDFDFGSLTTKNVTLIVNDESVELATNAVYIDELLADQDIQLREGDTINLAANKRVENGATIRIVKLFDISIAADGKAYTLKSAPVTVAEALQEAGVFLGVNDEISVPTDQYLREDTQIQIARITKEEVVEEEEIEPTVVRQEDANMASGRTETIQVGESGIRQNIYSVTYRDGQECQRELIESKVTQEPGTTIVAYGTKVLASRSESRGGGVQWSESAGEKNFSYSKKLTVEATAYTATGNRTATGTWPKVGTIAVDPRYIPLGTRVYIDGYGYATAEDTGGAIKGNIIDLYMNSYDECIRWGRRSTTLYILE
ncbi:MAG: G5 domain-containing protein [Firmicutes bacterium]|nr:G5 domain-containing protein [Bacillota bacterium]